jgi:TolB-like protein
LPDIFLSYSRDDLPTARRFAEAFEREGYSVWWDQTLNPGEAFDEVTEKALNDAKAVVVLWSKKSVGSRWVRAEATQANESRTLFPVMIESCKRPIMFELTHTADLSHWKGDPNDTTWQTYLAGVRRFVNKEAPGTSPNHAAQSTNHAPKRFSVMAAASVLAALVVAGALWWMRGHKVDAPAPAVAGAAATPSSPASTPVSSPDAVSAASIAVMPFTNQTGDAQKEYFSDGMAEELINKLSKVSGLKVASRPSSFAYKGKGTDIRQVARELKVKTILEGSVRSAGETIRITAQLIDAESGYNLWSESYDRKYADVFKLQDDLAGQIVNAFRMTMGASLPEYTPLGAPTQNLEAYSLYLQAVAAARGNTTEANHRSIALLERAVAEDPKFAVAYAALAEARWVDPQQQPLADVERDARRAVELDPKLGAQFTLGYVEASRGNWLAAAQRFEESVKLDRNVAGATVAAILMPTGQVQAAVQLQLRAAQNNPALPVVANTLSRLYNALGRDAEAIRYADLAVGLGIDPAAARQPNTRADVAARAGRYDEAAKLMIGALPPRAREAGGAEVVQLVYSALGDPSKRPAATAALQGMLRKLDQPGDWELKVWSLAWFTQLGALDQAYEAGNQLQKQFAQRSPAAGWSWLWSGEMRPFRQDARFQPFVTRLGMMPYFEKYVPPDDCELQAGKLTCH